MKTLLFLLAAVSLTACGSKSDLGKYEPQRIAKAPANESEMGVVVSGVSEEKLADYLEQNPEAQFRKIHSAQGIYEIYQKDLSQVQENLDSLATPNKWIAISPRLDLRKAAIKALEEAMDEGSVQPTASGERLNRCIESPLKPLPKIKVLSPAQGLKDQTLPLGVEIELDGNESQAHPQRASELKYAFAIFAPGGSLQEQTVVFDTKIKYKPDTLGMYAALLVVQDSADSCAMEQVNFIVTDNQPFIGNDQNVDDELSSINIGQLQHLPTVDAEASWEISQGEGVTIAVVDSGVNYNHPALLKNIQVNAAEIPGNDLDDDGNGFVDDYVGYDFQNDDAFPFDDGGHGSHVSGLAASSVFGLAKKAKIISIKALGPVGGDVASIAAAIMYAVDRGAKVVNMSFGSYGMPHPLEIKAIDYAEEKGVLLVAAAGNGDPNTGKGIDTDRTANFPSALPNDNILAVAAHAKDRLLAPYSNFGATSVDVAAPGGADPDDLLISCFSWNPNGYKYVGMSGTSMASPVVSGIAAQVLSVNPNLSVTELKSILMKAGKEVPGLVQKVQSGRYISAKEAVDMALATLTPVASPH